MTLERLKIDTLYLLHTFNTIKCTSHCMTRVVFEAEASGGK